ncbi:hypothetical protein BU17DRAFT_86593 [Hysterangium stoloniferum]|nr:hypothetical protein BU17DRAFT_86593 [Hysterangium stoloniferum]
MAKTAAKKKSSSLDMDQRARMCVNLSTIDECAEGGVIIQDFTTDTEMNEKDNFDDDFHPMLDEQSDEIDGDESLKAPLVEAVMKNSAKQAQHVSSWVKAWASRIMGISDEMPPNTPLFSHFFSAPANSKVEPPKLAGGVRASEAIQIPLPLPSNIPLNSSNMAAFPDIHSLLMTQVVGMSQMQMQMLQNMLGTPRRKVVSSPNPGAIDGTIIVDDSTDYPRFDEYFESIGDKVVDHDLGAILAKLTDSGVYRVHELAWFIDAELKEAGLVIGDVKWLRNEVKRAMQKELHV